MPYKLPFFLFDCFWISENGQNYDFVDIYFSKVSDEVPQEKLVRKVAAHSIGGKVIYWIRVWPTDRKERVSIIRVRSKWCSVISGVPQGSVLGPLLFRIYISDLDEEVDSSVSKFVDDTKSYHNINSTDVPKRLQEVLNRITVECKMVSEVDCGWM